MKEGKFMETFLALSCFVLMIAVIVSVIRCIIAYVKKKPDRRKELLIAIVAFVVCIASIADYGKKYPTETQVKPEKTSAQVSATEPKEEEKTPSTTEQKPKETEQTKPANQTEDEYKASCKEIDYKELCRYPEKYTGEHISVKVKVQQILEAGFFTLDKAWRAYTDESGYGWYADDEYYMIDKRGSGSVKVLEDDVVRVYGEFAGLEKITRALTGQNDELPKINVKYADLLDDAPEKTYEEILEEYSQKMRDATPRLISEYQEEAKQNQNGITGLAELSQKKVEKLANINSEGTEEMSKIYMYNGSGSYDEYSEWSGKLFDVYMEEAGKITDAYMASAR
nr:MAG TPA: hypothetical protein [Caudoviricetes sp.]